MPSDNPLNDGVSGPEPLDGEIFNNQNVRKEVSVGGQVFVISENITAPGENSTYVDTRRTYLHTDPAGNPIPEDPSQYIVSHTIRIEWQCPAPVTRHHRCCPGCSPVDAR